MCGSLLCYRVPQVTGEAAEDGSGVYKAPHIAAMPYEEDESAGGKRDRKEQAVGERHYLPPSQPIPR